MHAQEAQRFEAICEWQVKSDAKVKSTVVKQRYEELRARREADLDARRSRLASKLMREDMQNKQELVSMQETPEQRRAKVRHGWEGCMVRPAWDKGVVAAPGGGAFVHLALIKRPSAYL